MATTLPTAGPRTPSSVPSRAGGGLGGLSQKLLVSHRPAQEVAASCPALLADHRASVWTTEKRPFAHDLGVDCAPLHWVLAGRLAWWARSGSQPTPQTLVELWGLGEEGLQWAWGGKREIPLGDGCEGKSFPEGTVCGEPKVIGGTAAQQEGPGWAEGLQGLGPRAGASQVLPGQGASQEATAGPGGAAVVPQLTQPASDCSFGHTGHRDQRGEAGGLRPHSSLESGSTH